MFFDYWFYFDLRKSSFFDDNFSINHRPIDTGWCNHDNSSDKVMNSPRITNPVCVDSDHISRFSNLQRSDIIFAPQDS